MVELVSILLVGGIMKLKAMLYPKLQDRVILIDIVLALLISSTNIRGIVLFAYFVLMLSSSIIKICGDIIIEMAESRVYHNTQKLRMKILEEILHEDEHHKNS